MIDDDPPAELPDDDDDQAEAEDAAGAAEPSEFDQGFQAGFDDQAGRRHWIEVLTAVLKARREDEDPRVQYALHMAMVAACERIGRECRSDLPADRA